MSGLLPSVVLAAAVAGSNPGAGTAWDRYSPGTVSAVVDSNQHLVCDDSQPEDSSWTIAGDDHARTAIMAYTGRSRPLSELRRELLALWLTSLALPSSVLDIFEREYLFHEGEQAYWLPVQGPVSTYFSAEVEPYEPVLLYVIWAGAHCSARRATWLFLVNEFQVIAR